MLAFWLVILSDLETSLPHGLGLDLLGSRQLFRLSLLLRRGFVAFTFVIYFNIHFSVGVWFFALLRTIVTVSSLLHNHGCHSLFIEAHCS